MEKIKIEEKEFNTKLKELKLEEMNFGLVMGIGSNGIIPGKIISGKLGIEFELIEINFRDEKNKVQREKPLLLKKLNFDFKNKRILLVDDFCNTGKTFEKAKKELKETELIKTLAVNCRNKKADYCLFNYKECAEFFWK